MPSAKVAPSSRGSKGSKGSRGSGGKSTPRSNGPGGGMVCPNCHWNGPAIVTRQLTHDACFVFWICFAVAVFTGTFICCWCFIPLCVMKRDVFLCARCKAILPYGGPPGVIA